jgi:hypothetical protein
LSAYNLRVDIHVSRRRLIWSLGLATAAFSAMGITVEIASGHYESRGWLVLFDLDKEWNLPTIFSALLLFAASALLAMIATEGRRIRARGFRHWMALAAIFSFLGADELFSIHNSAKRLVPVWFKQISLFNLHWDLRWVVVGIPVTFVIVVLFVPFVLRLPRRTACGFIIAGTVYIGAAIGLEMIGGWWIGTHTKDNWTYASLAVFEETLEMVGAVIFLNVLLDYAERDLRGQVSLGSFVLQLETPQPAATRLETRA